MSDLDAVARRSDVTITNHDSYAYTAAAVVIVCVVGKIRFRFCVCMILSIFVLSKTNREAFKRSLVQITRLLYYSFFNFE